VDGKTVKLIYRIKGEKFGDLGKGKIYDKNTNHKRKVINLKTLVKEDFKIYNGK
jgi:hypothetical protein